MRCQQTCLFVWVVLRIYLALRIARTFCSASQELNHSNTTAPTILIKRYILNNPHLHLLEKWVIELDARYRDHVDVNKQWVELKQTTVNQQVVIFFAELFFKMKMHLINTVLVISSVSLLSWLRIKLQALRATSSFTFVLSRKILNIFLFKN